MSINQPPLSEDMIRMHGDLLNRELSPEDKQTLIYIIEAMTNINTVHKTKVFEDLCSCFPKLNYEELASKL